MPGIVGEVDLRLEDRRLAGGLRPLGQPGRADAALGTPAALPPQLEERTGLLKGALFLEWRLILFLLGARRLRSKRGTS
eukprot:5580966-Lingulodinium_polyedra.AAC.1